VANSPLRRCVSCLKPDEAPHVGGEIGEPDFHDRSGNADRADEQPHQPLLMREHVFDRAADVGLLRVGNPPEADRKQIAA
jgi:hypothetical protein